MSLFPADHRDAPAPPLAAIKVCRTSGCGREGAWSEAKGAPGTWMCSRCYAATGRHPSFDEHGKRRS